MNKLNHAIRLDIEYDLYLWLKQEASKRDGMFKKYGTARLIREVLHEYRKEQQGGEIKND